ncbi:P-loop containing nucleoside triphosphate hydrolase protein, partial [Aspergillus steynii IBT 23096]
KSEAWRELEQMVGLEDVKQRVRLLHQRAQINAERKKGSPVFSISLNSVFLGPPGTGKSTVARLYGRILADLGLLSNGAVIETAAVALLGHHVGATERTIRKVINSAQGKVLIIDDAYALWGGSRTNSHSFHQAAIDTIVSCVSGSGDADQCVLLVGYEDQLEEMFRQGNPGLSRRFPLSSAFRFKGFPLPDLVRLLELKLQQAQLRYSPDAKTAAIGVLRHAMVSPRFGNAAFVEQIVEKAHLSFEQRRLSDPTVESESLAPEDFSKDWDRVVDAEDECRRLFQGVVGCDSIVNQILQDTRIAKKAALRGLNARDLIPFNYIFRGPPGTGKTTTARRMGQIFYHMGLLATAEVVESSVTDLIGQYVGQTGPKVLDLFDKALGKVLFIDEAYRLLEGSRSFSQDAVGEIVGALTNPRFQQNIVIILAGYSKQMDSLIASNPGLRSRFKRVMTFDSLTGVQCAQLLVQNLARQGLDTTLLGIPEYETHREICDLFACLSEMEDWGNARDVNTLS